MALLRSGVILLVMLPLIATVDASRSLRPSGHVRLPLNSVTTGCEPVRLHPCRSIMPYSRTKMPNLLDHATQRNARLVLDQYQSLIATGCGIHRASTTTTRAPSFQTDRPSDDYLTFFLCAVFAPICPAKFDLSSLPSDDEENQSSTTTRMTGRNHRDRSASLVALPGAGAVTIPPCRGVCERARTGCEPVMRRYNVSWPDELDCSRWPTQDRGICISPESIVGRKPASSFDPKVLRIGCRCASNVTRLTPRAAYLRSHFDYVVHATYIKTIRLRTGRYPSVVVRIRVRQILNTPETVGTRGGVQLVPNRTSTLWLTDCSGWSFCQSGHVRWPFRRYGDEYLIMGHVTRRTGAHRGRRIPTLDSRSVVLPWKKNWGLHVKKWERRYMKRNSQTTSEHA